jgi:exopolysaccharide biosynthesis polyprenyl glycosylphosphotransferase
VKTDQHRASEQGATRSAPESGSAGAPRPGAASAVAVAPAAAHQTLLGTFVRRHFEPLVLSVQVVLDLAVVLFSCLCAVQTREAFVDTPRLDAGSLWNVFLLTGAVCLVAFHAFGLYSPLKSLLNIEEFKAITKSVVVSFLVLHMLIVFLAPAPTGAEAQARRAGSIYEWLDPLHRWIDLDVNPFNYSRLVALLSFGWILVLMMASRFASFKAIQTLHKRGIGNRNVLIVGTGPTARRLEKKFLLVPTLGLNLAGFVSTRSDGSGPPSSRGRVLGSVADLERLIGELKISEAFVTIPESTDQELMAIIERLEQLGVVYHVVPRFYHLMAQRVRIHSLDSVPLITRQERRANFLGQAAKRALDVAGSLMVITLSAPVWILTAIMIRRESQGPVFFTQNRIGQDGKQFRIYKFRTMHVHMSGDARKPTSSDDPRITRIGKWLRRYSLDELPQILNVLRGEMSLVGPRPEMSFIVDSYGPLERERLRVKPGLTGLWQISYARGEAIHENIDYDLYYIENQSLLLDLVILALTSFAVIKGTGAY